MSARIKISQAGLAAGVAGRSRTDGLATGALVTLEDVEGTGLGLSTFHLLWVPPEDTNAEATLAQTIDLDVWTFSPMAAAYGSYQIELRVSGVSVERRIFGIRTPANQLLIPALNERASRHASLDNDGADQIELCEQNANDFPLSVLNSFRYAGWWRSLYELYRVVEFGIGSIADHALALVKLVTVPAKSFLVNASNAVGNVATLAGSAAYQYPRVNAANNALEMATLAAHGSVSVVYDAASNTFKYAGATSNVNSSSTSGALGVVDISTLECGGSVTFAGVSADAAVDGFTAKTDGFWFALIQRDSASAFTISVGENVGNTTTSVRTPTARGLRLQKNDAAIMYYSNARWRTIQPLAKPWQFSEDNVTFAGATNNYARTSAGICNLRVTLTGNQTLSGVVPDAVSGSAATGEVLTIENIDTTDTLTIAHDATSTAANRFFCPGAANYSQLPLTTTVWRYDGTSSRWRMMSHS
jgi:hypothetical protein